MAFTLCSNSFPKLCLSGKKSPNKEVSVALPLRGADNPPKFLEDRAKELAQRHQVLVGEPKRERPPLDLSRVQVDYGLSLNLVDAAYDRCGELLRREGDPFAFGSLFLNPDNRKALWALWAWAVRLDELGDGIISSHSTPKSFDRWRERLNDNFCGWPWDIYDVALSDTLAKFTFDKEIFYEMIEGLKFDSNPKNRFRNFEELYLYQYYGGVSFFLMLVQSWGFMTTSDVDLERLYGVAIALGLGFVQVDMLRDAGLDAKLGRIYFPQDELALAGISEDEIFDRKVTDKWRRFMKGQIKRVRKLIDAGKDLISGLNPDVQGAVWIATLLHRQALDVIEANGYDNLCKKVSITKVNKLVTLPMAYAKTLRSRKTTLESPPPISEILSKCTNRNI